MRVLHVTEDLGFGGVERLLATLLPALGQHGIETEVASLGRREDFAGPLRAAGIPTHIFGLESLRQPARAIRWLYGLLGEDRFDIVHTHLAHGNLYGRTAAFLRRVPVTSTYHDTDYEPEVLLDNPGLRRWKQRVYQLADGATSRSCARVIAVSEFLAASVVRRLRLSAEAVEVIYNGVVDLADVTADLRRQRRRELGLPDAPLVVQVGRLSAQKGQLHAVRAAALLRSTHPDVRWVLVGDGPQRAEIEAERGRLGVTDVVQLVGGRADVPRFLEAVDLFVFPSLHEGLGIAVLEAMAHGLPVVAFGTGPIPEVVAEGETGLLVPLCDDAALARAAGELLGEPDRARAMGARGRERVRERFLMARTAERHAAFYRRLVEA